MKKYYFLFFLLFFFGTRKAKAQYTILHNFNDTAGKYPLGSLTLSGNRLFGMTRIGGIHDSGCIFSVDTNGNGYKDLFDFYETNGKYPYGSLTISGNKLYGMTSEGGAYGYVTGGGYGWGVIFSIDTDGTGYRVLLDFNDTNGAAPFGSLILSEGVLYGMTVAGGSPGLNNYGCIFSIDTDGTRYRKLFTFNDTNGSEPIGYLTISGGKLFGMTSGGGANDNGCIFTIDTNGNSYRDLLDFNITNGPYPTGSLILSGSVLYGLNTHATTYGNIFSIDTDGSRYRSIFSFNDTNGAVPYGSLIISGNMLYGMTAGGGPNLDGTIFSIDTNGNNFKDLFYFDGINGENPYYGNLLISGRNLYGMTQVGGTNNLGVVFKIDTSAVASANDIIANKGAVGVYPNPNRGIFTILLSHAELVSGSQKIQIYNILGEKVFTETLLRQLAEKGDNTINLSSQPNGIYMYRVITENGKLLGEGKLVIQK